MISEWARIDVLLFDGTTPIEVREYNKRKFYSPSPNTFTFMVIIHPI